MQIQTPSGLVGSLILKTRGNLFCQQLVKDRTGTRIKIVSIYEQIGKIETVVQEEGKLRYPYEELLTVPGIGKI